MEDGDICGLSSLIAHLVIIRPSDYRALNDNDIWLSNLDNALVIALRRWIRIKNDGLQDR